MLENMILLGLVQNKGWDVVFRIEETKIVCVISMKLIVGWKTYGCVSFPQVTEGHQRVGYGRSQINN